MLEVTEEERRRAHDRSRRMYETDQISNIMTAEARGWRIGWEEGIKIGLEESSKEGVRLMFQKGFSVETIAKTLDLSGKDVTDILGKK